MALLNEYHQHHHHLFGGRNFTIIFLIFSCFFVGLVSSQEPASAATAATSNCFQIGTLGISPFCDGPVASNPFIEDWGNVNVAKTEQWLTFVGDYCDDENSDVYDKVVTVQGCHILEANAPPMIVAIHLFRRDEPQFNTTFVIVDEPDQECSSFHLCSTKQLPAEQAAEAAAKPPFGGTLEENFDYDCTNIEGGTKSMTCGHIETTINTDAPTPTPPEPELPDEANKPGQAPNATVFTSSGYDNDETSDAAYNNNNNSRNNVVVTVTTMSFLLLELLLL